LFSGWLRTKRAKTLPLRSSQIEAIEVHHLGPRRHEIPGEFLLGVRAPIDLCEGAELGLRTKDEVDALWSELSKGGSALMEIGEYPFSQRYGWTQDRYGLSWQLMFMGEREIKQTVTPTLMFVGQQCGRAEEAIKFYSSVFHDAKVDHILR